jgi:FkbM family methyltransferase
MPFRNAKNILAHCSPINSYKLLLASAMNSRPAYRAVWWALLQPFVRNGEVAFGYRCSERNMKASLRLDDLSSDIQSIWELCISDTYAIDIGFAPELVVDAGGNIGLFTLRMAAVLGAGEQKPKFVIVEPLPKNLQQIRKHLAMNAIDATVMPVCMGGSRRSIPFYCREAIRSSFDPRESYTSVMDLPVFRLQDVIGDSPASRIFVKMDIEGMELETLRAFVPSEQRAVYILGELHDFLGEATALEDLFRDHGWSFEYYEVADNYAHFRACSPAALPFLRTMAGAQTSAISHTKTVAA